MLSAEEFTARAFGGRSRPRVESAVIGNVDAEVSTDAFGQRTDRLVMNGEKIQPIHH